MKHMMTRNAVKAIGLLTICLMLGAALPAQAKGNVKGKSKGVKLTGTVFKGKNAKGKTCWCLKFKDGSTFAMRNPKTDAFTHEDYKDKKVSYYFRVSTETKDGVEKKTISRTYPIGAEEVAADAELPDLDPNVVIPNLKKPEDK